MLPASGRRVVFLHAHPDDETLATGALLAALASEGYLVAVVTATRGERGEVVAGVLPHGGGTSELVAHRLGELAGALAELGVEEQVFLGTPPARLPGCEPRTYTDSGMRWVTDTVAGPSADAGPESLTSADIGEAAADLAAYLRHFAADVLVGYDEHGGYGHPDHVACHRIAAAAAEQTGVTLLELVSEPLLPVPGAQRIDLPDYRPVARRALTHYASQLTVTDDEVVHVGGQRQPIVTSFWLTPA